MKVPFSSLDSAAGHFVTLNYFKLQLNIPYFKHKLMYTYFLII